MSSPAEFGIVPHTAEPSDAEVQALFARAGRLFSERFAERDGALAAFPANEPVTATDAMVTVSAMLKAVNVQIFELGMWQAWAGK